MNTIINGLRAILGDPNFYQQMNPNTNSYSWNYGEMIEYIIGALLLVITVSYIFRIVMAWINGRK